MHQTTRIFFLILFGFMLSCKTTEPVVKTDWPYGVKYEIFVLAFADGNGDGKGDLKGLTEKLGYLQSLGVNGIWLMPIMPSPSYHKYDVSDYKNIHPDYGTLEDFKKLTNEAHKRGIHVIIDMVINHTSTRHPWFQSAIQGNDSPYRDYYVWADKDSVQDQLAKKKITLDSDNIRQWHEVNGDSTAAHYYGFFSNHMPDLNFDNHKVREEMVEVARFWMEEMNVDGFRFDAARHIYPDERARDSHQFWAWYRTELMKIKPDIYLVGEVYSTDKNEVSPYAKGLPALFNFELGSNVIATINAGRDSSKVRLIERYVHQVNFIRSTNPDFLDAPILTNHDQNRVISQLGNDIGKAKVAASILLTMPGTPYLYYGEELGMRGTKPDEFIREPFLWGDSATTRWIEPSSANQSVANLPTQEQDVNSIYSHYYNLIQARNLSKALTFGTLEPISGLPPSIVGMKRTFDTDEVIVFHNISPHISVVELKDGLELYREIVFGSNDRMSLRKGKLALHPYATIIFKKKQP